MWFLTNSEGIRIYLERDKEWTFGRKQGDMLLENDNSVSRVHGSVTILRTEPSMGGQHGSTCIVKDLQSKYGTYVCPKSSKFAKIESHELADGDIIRFGLQNHIFVVHHVPIVTATSTISEEDKLKLDKLLDEMDGVLSEEWTTSCTHLTVTQALLTEKVVWAMASTVPIVTVAYWEHMRKAIDKGLEIPSINNFVPELSECLINKDKVSLHPNDARKEIFKDLIFIFFSAKQFKVYGKMIYLGGGKSIIYGKRKLGLKKFCLPNVVAVQFPDEEASQGTQEILLEYEEIYKEMRKKGLRIVPETEIPLAILHCSTKSYCNPGYKFKLTLEKRTPDLGKVIVPDTQDVDQDIRMLPTIISDIRVPQGDSRLNNHQLLNIIIPETCDFLNAEHTNVESDAVLHTAKKPPPDIREHSEPLKAQDKHFKSNAEKKSLGPSKLQDKNFKSNAEKTSLGPLKVPDKSFKSNAENTSLGPPKVQDKSFKSNAEKKSLGPPKVQNKSCTSNAERKGLGPPKVQDKNITSNAEIKSLGPSKVQDKSFTSNAEKKSLGPSKVQNKNDTSNAERKSVGPKESQIPALPTVPAILAIQEINETINEKVGSLVEVCLEVGNTTIIPETLDISNASSKPSTTPILIFPEVSISLTPKKPSVAKQHTKIVPESSERSPTLDAYDKATLEAVKTNSECPQLNNKVVNWLALSEHFLPETAENISLSSPVKSPSRNHETFRSPMNSRLPKQPTKKRNRMSSDAEEEFVPPAKRNSWLDKSKSAAPSETNTLSSINANCASYIRRNPVNKHFKKAKILIPARRILFENMTG